MTLPPPAPVIRTISLTVEAMADGRVRFSSPQARGWASVARTPHELRRGLDAAFQEVGRASVARATGQRYDLDGMTMHVPGDALAGRPQSRPRGPARQHRGAYYPEEWTKMEDGRWRSPGGRAYRADSTQVKHVIRKRIERGLSI